MNQEFPAIEVTPVGNGLYRVFSLFDKESIALTAQGLLELSIWIAEQSERLATETEQEAARSSTGANMLISG